MNEFFIWVLPYRMQIPNGWFIYVAYYRNGKYDPFRFYICRNNIILISRVSFVNWNIMQNSRFDLGWTFKSCRMIRLKSLTELSFKNIGAKCLIVNILVFNYILWIHSDLVFWKWLRQLDVHTTCTINTKKTNASDQYYGTIFVSVNRQYHSLLYNSPDTP